MSDNQDLLDTVMENLKKHSSLAEVERASKNDGMHMYHVGHVNAYNTVASYLVNRLGCEVAHEFNKEIE